MACDIPTIILDSRCFECDIPYGLSGYVALALMCRFVNGDTMACDIPTLLDEAKCLECKIPQGLLPYTQLAALCALAGTGGGGLFVLRTGDTMTGELELPSALPSLQFGGTTSSFPALGNSGAFLQARLADNSAYAIFQAGFTQANQVDTSINTQPVAFEAYHDTSSGTPAANCGVAIDMRADSATVDRQLQARLTSLWNVATDATRTSELRVSTVLTGTTTEALRVNNTLVDARNGTFFGVAGTQVVSARNTGWTTFAGTANKNAGGLDTGTATTAQVAQVVKSIMDALIAHGLIGT